MGNDRLRAAMVKAHLDAHALSQQTGVDPKTVQRGSAVAPRTLDIAGPSRSCSTERRCRSMSWSTLRCFFRSNTRT